MFLVGETWEERKAKIQRFAEQDDCVGVILATINVEWCLRRCILILGSSPTAELKASKMSGLGEYNDFWKTEVAPRTGITLPKLIDQQVKISDFWKTTKSSGMNAWNVLIRVFELRNKLVHGVEGGAPKALSKDAVIFLLEVADALIRFVESQGASIFARLKTRKLLKDKNKVFKRHIDVLHEVFGIQLKTHRRAAYLLKGRKKLVWFPKLGNEEWKNHWSEDGKFLFEAISEDEKKRLLVKKDEKFRRYTFLKSDEYGYKFVGIFKYNKEKSTNEFSAYECISPIM